MVFPAEWNVAEQKWEPYTLAEDWPDPAYDWNQNCAGCHTTGLDPDRGRWKDDGVQCEVLSWSRQRPRRYGARMSGATPTDAELIGIRAAIVVSPDAQVCGQCHSQGVDPGDRSCPIRSNYRPGEDLAQSFTLSEPDDTAHWRSSGHAASQNMQYNEWLHSGHASSLDSLKTSTYAEDSCLECHSADYQLTEQMRAAVRSRRP